MTGKQAASYSTTNNKGEPVLYAGDRLTKDQLEIVVEKHKKNVLQSGGRVMIADYECKYGDNELGCVMQHLNHDPLPKSAFDSNPAVASWFDHHYRADWTEEQLRSNMIASKLIEE